MNRRLGTRLEERTQVEELRAKLTRLFVSRLVDRDSTRGMNSPRGVTFKFDTRTNQLTRRLGTRLEERTQLEEFRAKSTRGLVRRLEDRD